MVRRQRIHDPAISRLLASPIRLEILGQFTTTEALAVQDLAQRMGRPATALHYHIRLLQRAGILQQVDTRRSGKRREALYRPAAQRFEVATDRTDERSRDAGARTMAAAFRMAQRDLQKALEDPKARSSGAQRNLLGMRLHMRLRAQDLAELNRRLAAVEQLLGEIGGRAQIPDDADQFCSLTILLAPLRDRQA